MGLAADEASRIFTRGQLSRCTMNRSATKSNRVRFARNGRLKLIVGEEVHLEGADVVF